MAFVRLARGTLRRTRVRRLLGTFLAAALAAAFIFALAASQALASHVRCGDLITQDTTLDSDLLDCPDDGVVIGAPNITVDLGGHLIDGVAPGPSFSVDTDGIDNRGGHDGVTVENGAIREFGNGVNIGGFRPGLGTTPSNGNVVRSLAVLAGRGVSAWDTTALTVEQSAIEGRFGGIVLIGGNFPKGSRAVISSNV